jgi:hypothetical protein
VKEESEDEYGEGAGDDADEVDDDGKRTQFHIKWYLT